MSAKLVVSGVVVGLLAIALAALLASYSHDRPGGEVAEARADVGHREAVASPEPGIAGNVRELVRAAPPEQQPLPDGQAKENVVVLEPPLVATEKERIRGLFDRAERSVALDLARFRETMDVSDERALQQEAGKVITLERTRAVLAALERDRYAIVPRNAATAKQMADGVVVFGNSAKHGGVDVDVQFPLRYRDYPDLEAAVVRAKSLVGYANDAYCRRFNSKPDDERVRLIDAHTAAVESSRKLLTQLAGADAETRARIEQQMKDLGKQILPDFAVIDGWILRSRERK